MIMLEEIEAWLFTNRACDWTKDFKREHDANNGRFGSGV